jgi:hypothetical protein
MGNYQVQGGNKAKFCELTTDDYSASIADALGTPIFSYDSIISTSKESRPELQDWTIELTQAEMGSAHNTFLENNLVKVAETEGIDINFEDNTVFTFAEAPSNTETGLIISISGKVGSANRRIRCAYAYLQNSTESEDSANTNVTTTDIYKPVPTPCELTITTSSFNALFSDKCTISGDIVLTTGSYGKIVLGNV